MDARLYASLPSDLKAVIKQSTIDTRNTDNGSAGTTTTATPYLFIPELSNFSSALKDPNGYSTIYVTFGSYSGRCTEYANEYDSGVFPLFSGMSLTEIANFMRLSDKYIVTRTAIGYKFSSGISINSRASIRANDTYTICKERNSGSNYYYTFCFRV